MATFTDLLANLDPSPQVRGRQFERICKWYLRQDPIYRAQVEKVLLWDEWPERDGRDLGIDLVARTKDGKLWAIQAKAYDPEKTLRKPDVDSFLANSARSEFSFRLILTTCKDLSGNLRKQFTQVEPPVSAKVLSDLESADLIWPESPDALRAPKPERKSPREHQAEAIRAVLKGFKNRVQASEVALAALGEALVNASSVGECWVFPSPRDATKCCSRHLMRDWWYRAERQAGLPHIDRLCWHGLRRKFATDFKHHPPADVSQLGGWKRAETVLRLYQKPDPATQREMLDDRRSVRVREA